MDIQTTPTQCNYSAKLINRYASGHWPVIHPDVTPLDPAILDGGDYPCPVCGGNDRFNVCRENYPENGKLFCKAPCVLHGAVGLVVIQKMNSISFPEACRQAGEWLVRNGNCTAADLIERQHGGKANEEHGRADDSPSPAAKKDPVSKSAKPKPRPKPTPYKLPKPKKGTKKDGAPKVHETAEEAMDAVAYGLCQGGRAVLRFQRPADKTYKYYVTAEVCAFIMCRWDLVKPEAEKHGSNKIIRPIHMVEGGWQSGNQMSKDRPLYGLFPRLLKYRCLTDEVKYLNGRTNFHHTTLTFEHIPDVANAETVYIVEGEPKVDVLLALGVNAVAPAHGAQSPHQTDWSPLRNAKTIILIPDNDEAGFEFVRKVRGLVAIHAPDATTVVKDLADDRGL